MTWVRVQTEHGVRYAAPSYAHPPTLEGFDKLFDGPQHIRILRCLTTTTTDTASALSRGICKPYFSSLARTSCGEDVVHGGDETLVLITRTAVGAKGGATGTAHASYEKVYIAIGLCAGSSSDATLASLSERLMSLMQCVLTALRCGYRPVSRNQHLAHAGVRAMLDALCTLPPLTLTAQTGGILAEPDGLPLTDRDRAIFSSSRAAPQAEQTMGGGGGVRGE